MGWNFTRADGSMARHQRRRDSSVAKEISYDSRCYDLAEVFLSDPDDKDINTDVHRHHLAQVIQAAIEIEIEYMRTHKIKTIGNP
jgi:hypothetical protein